MNVFDNDDEIIELGIDDVDINLTPLNQAISEMLFILELDSLSFTFRESIFECLFDLIDNYTTNPINEVFSVDFCSTKRAGKLGFIVYPSNWLTKLLTTLRAARRIIGIQRENRFSHCSTPYSRVDDMGVAWPFQATIPFYNSN
jgi:hypothetical protein